MSEAVAVPVPTAPRPREGDLRVVVLGKGAIGAPVREALASGHVQGAQLTAIVDRRGATRPDGEPIEGDTWLGEADLVVEAAGQPAVASLGTSVIAAGVDLLVLSIGALGDEDLHDRLSAGPGRLYLSTGAIGGLDVLRAVADAGTLQYARIETTKKPRTLIQDWMSQGQRAELLDAVSRVEVLRGSPQHIAGAFPASANVAMAVAAAAGSRSLVEAAVFADPTCTVTTHEITVESTTGTYRFQIANRPSPENPATSGLVPLSVLRAIRDLAGRKETVL
ncbi:aspartate dehydrogenase domain-containing protein [Aeromicrobium piscarium]|uniref:L-aspartate dehydrogenase n=1 Tax=Aeromicrobium piscarium TaxID=2590901 RepID=A0A554RNY3_9ACTN|nr:aspartate dehydrogenase domain-containing protein [Aeromicrobium piscarium]TSD55828.1 DUF108 domain-containing protein [Aeromicrobium piscarium]